MTSNQINYLNVRESERHNQATETETNRSNLVRENQDKLNYLESVRTHRANEGIAQQEADTKEQSRKDSLKMAKRNLKETKRSNRANEKENRRYHKASLKETKRSNRANETIGRTNAGANVSQAYSAYMNANTNRQNAYTNARNAAVNERNAATNEYNAKTNRKNVNVTNKDVNSKVEQRKHQNKLTDEQIKNMRQQYNNIIADTNLKRNQAKKILSDIGVNEIMEQYYQGQITAQEARTRLDNAKAKYQENENAVQPIRDAITDIGKIIPD